jgi:hypothetical protein
VRLSLSKPSTSDDNNNTPSLHSYIHLSQDFQCALSRFHSQAPRSSRRFHPSNPTTNFIDSFYEEQPPKAPFVPSLPVTTAVNPSTSSEKTNPAVSQDATAFFEPLVSIPTNSRITQVSAMAPTARATPTAAYAPLVPPPSSFSLPNPHVCGPSDDVGFFLSTAASLHPLIGRPTIPTPFLFAFSQGIEWLRMPVEYSHLHHEQVPDGSKAAACSECNGILRVSTRDEDEIFAGLDDDGRFPGGIDEVSVGG